MMEQIGRYRILGELGRGAMGVVYRAQDPTIGRTVAIKTIRLVEVTDIRERERLRERLIREAQSAGALSHPNIVTVYDVAEENGLAYIAMEYVKGQTLERLLGADHVPDGPRLLEILRHTAAALDYAHKNGIVHRDIKPANIMIDEAGVSKITDFGVAKILSQQMTQAAGIIGTPNYMSREQVEGAPLDGRADQFSLAVIAYEVLTGEKPFVGDPLPTLLYKIVHEEPPPPQRLNPSLGWQVETVLKKALAKDPVDRYPNCSEFIKALAGACHAKKGWKPIPPGKSQSMPTIASTSPAIVPPRRAATVEPDIITAPPEPSRKPLLALLLLVLLGIGGYAAYHFLSRQPVADAPTVAETPPPVQDPATAPATPEPAAPVEDPPTAAAVPTEEPAENTPAPVVEPPRQAAAAREEMVDLRSTPPGAIVVVDGKSKFACRTPCTVPLTPGKHTAVASLSGFRGTMRTFEVPAETSVNVVLEKASGALAIRSTPPGATISINGVVRPEKTPSMITLPEGKYKLLVSRNGVSSEEVEVDVREGVTRTINLDFGERP